MLGVFYKDFTVMKKELLLNLFVIAVFSVLLFLPWKQILDANDLITETINGETMTYVIMPFVVYSLIFIIISGLQNNILCEDERKVYCAFIISTPLTAKGQVLSKYYETLFLSFAGVIWGTVCDCVSFLVSGTPGSAMNIYLSLFFIQIFLRAIDLPFLIRFGQNHGKTIKLIMCSLAVAIGIVYILFGKIPDGNLNSALEYIIIWFINEKNVSTFMLGMVSLFPYISMLMFYISYQISVKIYQRGVESYGC